MGLRREVRPADGPATWTLSSEREPIPLNCPFCGRLLVVQTTAGGQTVYHCARHGRF